MEHIKNARNPNDAEIYSQRIQQRGKSRAGGTDGIIQHILPLQEAAEIGREILPACQGCPQAGADEVTDGHSDRLLQIPLLTIFAPLRNSKTNLLNSSGFSRLGR